MIMRGRRRHRGHGVAMASACDACCHLIGSPPAWAPDCHMAPVHYHHVPELVARGWVVTAAADGGPDDVACKHYHLKNWEGGHEGCCGMDAE